MKQLLFLGLMLSMFYVSGCSKSDIPTADLPKDPPPPTVFDSLKNITFMSLELYAICNEVQHKHIYDNGHTLEYTSRVDTETLALSHSLKSDSTNFPKKTGSTSVSINWVKSYEWSIRDWGNTHTSITISLDEKNKSQLNLGYSSDWSSQQGLFGSILGGGRVENGGESIQLSSLPYSWDGTTLRVDIQGKELSKYLTHISYTNSLKDGDRFVQTFDDKNSLSFQDLPHDLSKIHLVLR